jgi:cell division protein ZapA
MDKTKVIVNINGNEYIIKGEESQEEMLKIASYVDKKIKDLTSLNNKLNPTYVSVLSALNITNEFFKMKKEFEELKSSSLDPIKQLNDLKVKNNSTVKENSKLLQQLDIYSKDVEKSNLELKRIQEQHENLNNEYASKNEELSKSYREYELMRREKENKQKELERLKLELSESKYKLIDLQNQLLQNQIDLVKTKKEFDELRINYNQGSNVSKI